MVKTELFISATLTSPFASAGHATGISNLDRDFLPAPFLTVTSSGSSHAPASPALTLVFQPHATAFPWPYLEQPRSWRLRPMTISSLGFVGGHVTLCPAWNGGWRPSLPPHLRAKKPFCISDSRSHFRTTFFTFRQEIFTWDSNTPTPRGC